MANNQKKNSEIDQCSYYTFIYLGNCSLRFQKRIRTVFEKNKVTITPSHTTKNVAEYFNDKNKFLKVFDTNVIYKYTCSADQSISYIGETSRQMFRRVADH